MCRSDKCQIQAVFQGRWQGQVKDVRLDGGTLKRLAGRERIFDSTVGRNSAAYCAGVAAADYAAPICPTSCYKGFGSFGLTKPPTTPVGGMRPVTPHSRQGCPQNLAVVRRADLRIVIIARCFSCSMSENTWCAVINNSGVTKPGSKTASNESANIEVVSVFAFSGRPFK